MQDGLCTYPRLINSFEFESNAGIMMRSNRFICGSRDDNRAGIVRHSSMAVLRNTEFSADRTTRHNPLSTVGINGSNSRYESSNLPADIDRNT